MVCKFILSIRNYYTVSNSLKIEKLYYNGKELEDDGGGSTNGKGFTVKLGWFNTKWTDSLDQYAEGSEGFKEALRELTEQLEWEAENN